MLLCSTYYSFCGNAGLKQKGGSAGEFRAAICNKWLHPVAIRDHPAFASWVLYGMHTHLTFVILSQNQPYPKDAPFYIFTFMTCIVMHIVSRGDIALLHRSHRRRFLLCGVHAMLQIQRVQQQQQQQQYSLFELCMK